MSYTRRTRRNEYYLDVSDFVLSDPRQVVPSPRRTPIQQIHMHDGVELSPYFAINGPTLDIEFYDFTLEIPEENEQNQFSDNEEQYQNDQNQHIVHRGDIIMEEPLEEEGHSQEFPDYTEVQISRYNMQYFNDAMTQLKKMKATQGQVREFVMEYIIEDNLPAQEIENLTLAELIEIAHENLRPVGPISWLQRKIKVNKYINKKKKRVWKKKISYDCRKRVADNRLRVKGKFVTKKQACNMLGVDEISQQDLKLLLEAKTTKSSEL